MIASEVAEPHSRTHGSKFSQLLRQERPTGATLSAAHPQKIPRQTMLHPMQSRMQVHTLIIIVITIHHRRAETHHPVGGILRLLFAENLVQLASVVGGRRRRRRVHHAHRVAEEIRVALGRPHLSCFLQKRSCRHRRRRRVVLIV